MTGESSAGRGIDGAGMSSRVRTAIRRLPEALAGLSRRQRYMAGGAAAIAVVGAAVALYLGRAQSSGSEEATLQTAFVQRGDLVISATGSGTLTAPEEKLGFTGSGEMTVTAVNVSAGDLVKEGNVLAEVDRSQTQQEYEKAQSAYADLTSITGQAAALRKVADAQAELVRVKGTLEYLISPEVMYWEEEIARGEEALETAKAQVQQTPNDPTAQAAEEKAEAFLDFAQDKLSDAMELYYDEYVPMTFGIKEDLDVDTYNVPSELEITKAHLAVDEAKKTLKESQELYDALRSGAIPEDTTNPSLLEVRKAQEHLKEAKTNLDGSRILAPFSGTVMEVNVAGGDVVAMESSEASGSSAQSSATSTDLLLALLTEGDSAEDASSSSSDDTLSAEGVIVLADTNEPYLEVYWNESDWPLLKVGNEVQITFDDRKDQVFTGKITEIDRQLYTSFESSTVRGEVSLESPFDELALPVGASASVEAIAERADNAVLIPIEALHKTDSGKTWVFVLADGNVRLRSVAVGLMDDTYAQVTSGLEAGEVVTTGLVQAG